MMENELWKKAEKSPQKTRWMKLHAPLHLLLHPLHEQMKRRRRHLLRAQTKKKQGYEVTRPLLLPHLQEKKNHQLLHLRKKKKTHPLRCLQT
jgi:hypothetical protein